jgi:hypothetical protein
MSWINVTEEITEADGVNVWHNKDANLSVRTDRGNIARLYDVATLDDSDLPGQDTDCTYMGFRELRKLCSGLGVGLPRGALTAYIGMKLARH